jgi:hypothetical protein
MEPTVTAVGWLWRGACGVVRVTPRTRSASNAKGLRMAWEDDIFDADAVDVSAWARELGLREDPRISALVKLVVRRCAVMVQTAGPQGDSDWVPAHHAAAMADAVALKLLQQFEADPNEVVLGIPHPYQRTHMVRPQRAFLMRADPRNDISDAYEATGRAWIPRFTARLRDLNPTVSEADCEMIANDLRQSQRAGGSFRDGARRGGGDLVRDVWIGAGGELSESAPIRGALRSRTCASAASPLRRWPTWTSGGA